MPAKSLTLVETPQLKWTSKPKAVALEEPPFPQEPQLAKEKPSNYAMETRKSSAERAF